MCKEGLQERYCSVQWHACHVQVAHQEGHYLGKLFRKHHIDGSGLPCNMLTLMRNLCMAVGCYTCILLQGLPLLSGGQCDVLL